MLRKLNSKGLVSMTEIVISATIMVIAAIGITLAIGSTIPQGEDSSRRLQAMYHAKGISDRLRGRVDYSQWTSGNLVSGVPVTETFGDITIDYMIYDIPDNPFLRQLSMNIEYPD